MTTTAVREPATDRPPIGAVVAEIAAQLGETEHEPIDHIRRVTLALGDDTARELATQALAIDEQGGLMLPDGSRRRTVGGVFFKLARERLGRKEALRVLGGCKRRKGQQGPRETATQRAQGARGAQAPAFTWEELGEIAAEALQGAGTAMTAKMTLIGTVGKVVERGDTVVVGMEGQKTPTAFPKGVPAPTSGGEYLALIGKKQWPRVAEALKADPADRLVIEGFPSLQEGFQGGITLHATSATTTGLQAAKRAAQQAAAAQNG